MDDRELDQRLKNIELNQLRIRDLLDDPYLTEEQLELSSEMFGDLDNEEEERKLPNEERIKLKDE